MYIMAFALLFFSAVVLTMAYSVSSIKKMIGEGGPASKPSGFSLTPELTALMSIKTGFPTGYIKTLSGKNLRERYSNISNMTTQIRNSETLAIIREFGSKTDRDYCEKLWNLNEQARYEISLIAADNFACMKPIDASALSSIEIFTRAHENFKFSDAMLKLAIERNDPSFAIDAAAANLSFSKALVNCFISEKIPDMICYMFMIASQRTGNIDRLFLWEKTCFQTPETILKFAAALEKRIRFIDSVPSFTEAVANQSELIKKAAANLPVREKLTLGMLNLWYGDPNEPYHEFARELVKSGKTDYFSLDKIMMNVMKKNTYRNTYTRELANSGDGIIAMFKFARFAINTHPLANSGMRFPGQIFADIQQYDSWFRIVTLGGLARCFYYENSRWPDLSKDEAFVKKAGKAAIDPNTGMAMQSETLADGTLKIWSLICPASEIITLPVEIRKNIRASVIVIPPDVFKK